MPATSAPSVKVCAAEVFEGDTVSVNGDPFTGDVPSITSSWNEPTTGTA